MAEFIGIRRLYPIEHNVLKNGNKLSNYFVTLTEIMQKNSYQTAGFASTNTHFIPSNIAQGFDFFNEPSEQYIQHSTEESGLKYRIATDTINKSIDWLSQKNANDKFFLFVHLFDVHRKLSPPDKNLQQAISATKINQKDFYDYLVNTQHIMPGFYHSKEELLRIINAYDGEINFVDTELHRLFTYIQSHNLEKNTLWIITADHGEGLGAHMYAEHGKNIYNEQIHVPLIIYPSLTGKAMVFDQVVEHVDIMPSIMDMVGLSPQENIPYPIEGVSLLPFLTRNNNTPVHKFSFAQRRLFDISPTKNNPLFKNYEQGDKFSLQDKNDKFIYHSKGENEFYNLYNDPYERTNTEKKQTKELRQMEVALKKKISTLKTKFQIQRTLVDKKTIKSLKGLGYIQ